MTYICLSYYKHNDNFRHKKTSYEAVGQYQTRTFTIIKPRFHLVHTRQ